MQRGDAGGFPDARRRGPKHGHCTSGLHLVESHIEEMFAKAGSCLSILPLCSRAWRAWPRESSLAVSCAKRDHEIVLKS